MIGDKTFVLYPIPARVASSYAIRALSLLSKGDAQGDDDKEIGFAVIASILSNPTTEGFVNELIDRFSAYSEIEIVGQDGQTRTPRLDVDGVFDAAFRQNQKALWIWLWENLRYNFSDFLGTFDPDQMKATIQKMTGQK